MTEHVPALLSLAVEDGNECRAAMATGDGNSALAHGISSLASSVAALAMIQDARLEAGEFTAAGQRAASARAERMLETLVAVFDPFGLSNVHYATPISSEALIRAVEAVLPYMDGDMTFHGVIEAYEKLGRPAPPGWLSAEEASLKPTRRAVTMDQDTLTLAKSLHAAGDALSNATNKLIASVENVGPDPVSDEQRATDAADARTALVTWLEAGQAFSDQLVAQGK